MDKTPPMKLPLRRTPKGPDDHVIINPAMSEWLASRKDSSLKAIAKEGL